ncbi:sigma-70 family RNA polymerase sigma factor [Tautonia sp. JC769]|uniref:sigma-70 family RNA polymerase sigma factor n=1 Tax=Tautonia sp. JC769 TaxID=3232135 RepID=UPI00345A5C3C
MLGSPDESDEPTDAQLLERFSTGRDEQADRAFARVVDRHGPMVLRTCRAVLRNEHDTHDAYQATFLVLAEKARSLRVRDSVGPWLHSVAFRVSCRVRSANARRARHERAAAGTEVARGPADGTDAEERSAILHGEIEGLPDRFRTPIVLCDLEGRSHEEAARRIGCPVGTVKSRLSRGRARLRARLERLGLPGLPASAAAIGAESPLIMADPDAPGPIPTPTLGTPIAESVHHLSQETIRMMMLTKLKITGAIAVSAAALVLGSAGLAIQIPGERGAAAEDEQLRKDRVAHSRLEQAELNTLLGTWTRVSLEVDGRRPAVSDAPVTKTFLDGYRLEIRPPREGSDGPAENGPVQPLRFSINPAKAPAELTYFGDRGGLYQCVYRIDGDRLVIAFYGRSEVDRPQGFSKENAGPAPWPLVVETLERADEDESIDP